MIRFICSLSLVLAACDNRVQAVSETCGEGPEAYAANPEAYKTISLWVQDDPELSASVALEGCDLWRSKCRKCEITASESAAAAKIYVSNETCVLDLSKGGFILGVADKKGAITIFMGCVRLVYGLDGEGHALREKLKLVIGHELGHESGMSYHVPSTCDPSAAASDFEKDLERKGVCGPALMNSQIEPQITAITQIDVEAYDLRDPSASTFPRVAAADTSEGCVLTSPVQ